MSDDDEFTPRLGRQRQQGGKRARRYLGRVVGAAIRSAEKGSVRSRRFDGSRIGRGASMGRLLSSRDRFGGMRARRDRKSVGSGKSVFVRVDLGGRGIIQNKKNK